MSNDLAKKLQAFFHYDEIEFLPGVVKGDRALAMPYIRTQPIMKRLDEVFGVMGWQDSYTRHADGCVECQLSAKDPETGEWVTKCDIGVPSDIEPQKGAFTDSLKRAAARWGIGRYLVRIPKEWYPIRNKRFTSLPKIPANLLPAAQNEELIPPDPDDPEVMDPPANTDLSKRGGQDPNVHDYCERYGSIEKADMDLIQQFGREKYGDHWATQLRKALDGAQVTNLKDLSEAQGIRMLDWVRTPLKS